MSAIEIQNQGGVLVVDSRLIAQDLGIEHRSLLQLIDDYQTQVEQAFGILRFENAEIEGRGRPARFAFLTEDQATFVMTLSRNTDAVVKAKLSLGRSFSAAKAALMSQVAPQPSAPTLPDAWAETASLLRLSAEFSMEPTAVLKVHQQLHGLIATPEPKSSPTVDDLKPRPVDVEAVQRFCEECGFVIAPDRSHFVQVRDVWTAYELWYEASGTTLFSKPQDVFRVISTVFPKVTHSRHSDSRRAIIRGLQKAKSDVYKPSWVSKVGETLEQLASMGMALTAANVINSLGIPHDRSSEMHVAAEAKLLGYRNKRVRSGEQNSRTWFRAE